MHTYYNIYSIYATNKSLKEMLDAHGNMGWRWTRQMAQLICVWKWLAQCNTPRRKRLLQMPHQLAYNMSCTQINARIASVKITLIEASFWRHFMPQSSKTPHFQWNHQLGTLCYKHTFKGGWNVHKNMQPSVHSFGKPTHPAAFIWQWFYSSLIALLVTVTITTSGTKEAWKKPNKRQPNGAITRRK